MHLIILIPDVISVQLFVFEDNIEAQCITWSKTNRDQTIIAYSNSIMPLLLLPYWFSNPYKMYLPPPRHIPENDDLSSLLIVVYLAVPQ